MSIESTILDYRSKTGVAFFGGAGSNILKLVIDGHDPKDYPDFFLFGANTDAKVQQRHFGNPEEANQKRWADARALTIHQLGGETVTKGRGAGARPDVGRKAAETEESMQAMRNFFDSIDELILIGAVGGGTGGSALPVAAKLAKDMVKPTIAIVVVPEPDDGRTKRATQALQEIQSLVPTIPIRNAYLKEVMNSMEPDARASITFKDAWRIVNENSVVPMLLIIREILQVTGDMTNFDQADWETMLSYGNHVFFGLSKVKPEKLKETTAEDIVTELFAARFQDPGLITQGKVIGLWGHGPWPKEKTDDVVKLIKMRVCGENYLSMADEVEVHKGIVHDPGDDKMWMALIIVAEELPKNNPIAAVVEEPKESKAPAESKPAIIEKVNVSSLLRFKSDGVRRECSVERDLATRYNRAIANIHSTKEELEKLFGEVKTRTGFMPDMPDKFAPKAEVIETKVPSFIGRVLSGGRKASVV